MTTRKFSGRMIVQADIGSDSSPVGLFHVALRLGEMALLFHPGYSSSHGRGVFRVEKSDRVIVPDTDMGFVPDVDTLHHMFVYCDGKNGFRVCLIDGLDPRKVFRTTFTGPDGDIAAPFAVGVHRCAGSGTGMFDNLRVYQLPDTASPAPTAGKTANHRKER